MHADGFTEEAIVVAVGLGEEAAPTPPSVAYLFSPTVSTFFPERCSNVARKSR
jgi:hypothetical protein